MNSIRTALALALTTALLITQPACQSRTDSGDQKSVVQNPDTVEAATNADSVATDTRSR
jgi:hypothetical protein